MVVSLVFFMPVILLAFLFLAIMIESDFIGKVTCFGMMAFGVYILIYGMETVANSHILVLGIGSIFVMLGFYILMADYIEEFTKELFIGR